MLANFEEQLKTAKAGKQFDQILEKYQDASAEADKELEKEKKKQMSRMEKRLKDRRNQVKAQIDLKKKDELNQIQKGADEVLDQLKEKAEKIEQIIKIDETENKSKNIQKAQVIQQKYTSKADLMFSLMKQQISKKVKEEISKKEQEIQQLKQQHETEAEKIQNELIEEAAQYANQIAENVTLKKSHLKELQKQFEFVDDSEKEHLL